MDLETLLARAAAGGPPDPRRCLRPSLALRVMDDPWWVWCEYHVPPEAAVREAAPLEELLGTWGLELQAAWVRESFPRAVSIVPRSGIDALRATLEAMVRGVPAIAQPHLWALPEELYGTPDLLVRDDSAPSDLGPYRYRVQEVKYARKPRPPHLVQAVLYNRMLGFVQGSRPSEVELVTMKREGLRLAVAPAEGLADQVLSRWRALRDALAPPEPPGYGEATSPWRVWTDRMLEEKGDPTLVPVLSASDRKKLRTKAGVTRGDQLASLDPAALQAALGPNRGRDVYFRLRAHVEGRPVVAPGFTLRIPRRNRRIYFDFETTLDVHPELPPHVYLIGACRPEGDEYRSFVARGPEDEGRMFEEFLAWVGPPADAALYHWTDYEIRQMENVRRRHPSLREPLRTLIRSCVDLKACLKGTVYFGCRTYSLKQVAPFVGFHWRQKDVNADVSMMLYWEWLRDRDPGKIQKAIRYNEDDCRAMLHIDRALEGRP